MSEIQVEDIPQDDQTPTPPTQTERIEHLVIANQFDIDSPTKEESGKLMEIYDYAKSMSKTGDMQDVIWQVINLKGTLGAPRLGESPLDKIYRWAKLKRHEALIKDQLKQEFSSNV